MNYEQLKECLRVEIIGEDHSFSWRKALTRTRHNRRKKFMFWWRVASYLQRRGGISKKIADHIEYRLRNNFDVIIPLNIKAGKGLNLAYMSGIIIGKNCILGENVHIKQGVTIGSREANDKVVIGNNVLIGCNSSILGGKLNIGDNVTIGAHSLVLDSIPSNSIYMNKITPIIKKDTKGAA